MDGRIGQPLRSARRLAEITTSDRASARRVPASNSSATGKAVRHILDREPVVRGRVFSVTVLPRLQRGRRFIDRLLRPRVRRGERYCGLPRGGFLMLLRVRRRSDRASRMQFEHGEWADEVRRQG